LATEINFKGEKKPWQASVNQIISQPSVPSTIKSFYLVWQLKENNFLYKV